MEIGLHSDLLGMMSISDSLARLDAILVNFINCYLAPRWLQNSSRRFLW